MDESSAQTAQPTNSDHERFHIYLDNDDDNRAHTDVVFGLESRKAHAQVLFAHDREGPVVI